MGVHRRAVLRGLVVGTAGVLAVPGLTWAEAASASSRGAGEPSAVTVDQTTVMAADGTRWPVNAVDGARWEGMLVQYTPDYGFTTFTNQWGAEVALEATTEPNQYRVTAVNSALTDPSKSGNTAIPANGMVLSAAPGGAQDAVAFLTEHFAVGDTVTILRPTTVDSSQTAAAVDPTAESNPDGATFPGFRGADQLLVYTPAYGKSTGTNQWGYELIVQGGAVTALAGANTVIPADGLVLSGHGTMATWLQQNGLVGAQVKVEGKTVSVHRDVTINIVSARNEVEELAAGIQERHDAFVNAPFDAAFQGLATARGWLAKADAAKGTDDQKVLFYCGAAISAAREAYYRSLPSRPADARGVWYRPVEKNAEQIAATLAKMKETGVNELYLETLWGGYTLYPSKVNVAHDLPAQRPEFSGFDPLKVWKREADRQKIALHAWIDGLAVGNELGDGLGPILTRHPEWAAVGRDHVEDGKPTTSPNGFYWLDVTDPVAHTYFLDLCAEMVREYRLAGIDLDYMRYPDESDWQHSFNFSDDARAAFKGREGVDPLTLSPDGTPDPWAKWTAFVGEEETRMVTDIYRKIKADDPSVVVSEAPEAGTEARKIGQWTEIVDVVIAQAYTENLEALRAMVVEHREKMTGGQLIYTGIGSMYNRAGGHATIRQSTAAEDIDTGTIIFAFGQAGPAHVRALSIGPWRTPAIPPGRRPVAAARALLEESRDEIGKRYLPRNGMAPSVATSLAAEIKALARALDRERLSDAELTSTDKRLSTLSGSIEQLTAKGRIKSAVARQLTEQISRCRSIIDYAIKRQMR
ncbi:glycoside hydrolase family 10 protein [Streptosporangium sp. NBC_01756]|uniref:glycoside hydrolase family 10 protein n=1 Tax=Streptosporangium sp. NBC_01756 TaxID=2975950 RepID=UPI002DDAB90A|nr:family 10 glycosylhydrolase [Streptosporangium sp. NBC_01756]WSC90355.1 family 10 glycosylhydrolase [Streptosporangium sp. NBC_01756]